jgi:hypothetical protein
MIKINASFLNIPKILVKSQINKEFFKRRSGEKLIANYKISTGRKPALFKKLVNFLKSSGRRKAV